jgi:predicted transcriptional regulator
MNIGQIKEILNAKVLTGADRLDREIEYAFGADLMSDVLAFVNEKTVLLTGLTNPQVIRTAEMMDITAIVYVRGKKPDDASIELAERNDMVILCTPYTLYTTSGLLYNAGLKGIDVLGVIK